MNKLILFLFLITPLSLQAYEYTIESKGELLVVVQKDTNRNELLAAFALRKKDVSYVGIDAQSKSSARLKFTTSIGTETPDVRIISTENDSKVEDVFDAFIKCTEILSIPTMPKP